MTVGSGSLNAYVTIEVTESSSNQTVASNPNPQAIDAISQTIANYAAVVPLAGTVFMASSSHSFWSLLNQFQLLLMLPLLRTYLPLEFVFFIREFKIALLSFSFLKFEGLGHEIEELGYPQESRVYKEGGIENGSHIINQIMVCLILACIVFSHLLMLLIYWLTKKHHANKTYAFICKQVSNFYNMMIYLRGFLETFLFMMLS